MSMRLLFAAIVGAVALAIALYARYCRVAASRRRHAPPARIAEFAGRGQRKGG